MRAQRAKELKEATFSIEDDDPNYSLRGSFADTLAEVGESNVEALLEGAWPVAEEGQGQLLGIQEGQEAYPEVLELFELFRQTHQKLC